MRLRDRPPRRHLPGRQRRGHPGTRPERGPGRVFAFKGRSRWPRRSPGSPSPNASSRRRPGAWSGFSTSSGRLVLAGGYAFWDASRSNPPSAAGGASRDGHREVDAAETLRLLPLMTAGRVLCRLLFRIEAHGPEHPPDGRGPPRGEPHELPGRPLLQILSPRPVNFLMLESVFDTWVQWFCDVGGCIPVSRTSGTSPPSGPPPASGTGRAVGIFPEADLPHRGIPEPGAGSRAGLLERGRRGAGLHPRASRLPLGSR